MKKMERFGKYIRLMPLAALLVGILFLLLMPQKVAQASEGVLMTPTFVGQYRYEDGPWQPLEDPEVLSAYEGDLHLKGHFDRTICAQSRLNYYCNHIGVRMDVNGEQITGSIIFELENYGIELQPAMCSRGWEWCLLPMDITPEDTVEIHLRNPHEYGNKSAYSDFLRTMSGSANDSEQMQNKVKQYDRVAQVVGLILLICSVMLLGATLAASVAHMPFRDDLLRFGLMTMFAGGFIVLDTVGLNLWSKHGMFNTYSRYLCMVLGAYCMELCVMDQLHGKRQTVARWATVLTAAVDSVLILLALTNRVLAYDTLFWWSALQLLSAGTVLVCSALEWLMYDEENSLLLGIYVLMFTALVLDILGVSNSIYSHGTLTKVTFILLFVVRFVRTAKGVFMDHQGAIRARKLESELEESRISIMLSQIQPHFLYNVLGTIRGLCREDPEQAREALGDFAKYLRGNMDALTNRKMIHFTQELRHVETYLRLEKMRMGERLEILYDVEARDFFLPPLTVQPLVENAVKHGIFNKPEGGTVSLHSADLGDAVEICVRDNGCGFVPGELTPENDGERSHVGLQNVRSRLQQMQAGSLTVESAPGQGTEVRLLINKNWSGEGD